MTKLPWTAPVSPETAVVCGAKMPIELFGRDSVADAREALATGTAGAALQHLYMLGYDMSQAFVMRRA